MARKYELKLRAERQAETRQRIVDAAVELHRTKGPAHTSLSEVARLAGVQRHTLYRYFPDERALGLACSGHFGKLHPIPDAEPWLELADPRERLRHGLGELYAYYERAEQMLSSVMRDAELDPLWQEIRRLRTAEPFGKIRAALTAVLPPGEEPAATLDLMLGFRCWQSLVRSSGLDSRTAADLATRLVLNADADRS